MAASTEQNWDWDDALSSGLLESYDGTITSASFGVDEDYNPETLRLFLDIEVSGSEDPDADVDPGQVISEAYNVGNVSTWEPLNGGKTVGKVDGKRPKFNERSGYGVLIHSILGDGEDAVEGREELRSILRERGPATEAKIWEGLNVRMVRRRFSFTNKDDEVIEYARMYPSHFLGVEGEAPAKNSGKAKAQAEISKDDVIAVFADAGNYGKGLAAVMAQFPGIEKGELATWVMDQDEGAWAESQEA